MSAVDRVGVADLLLKILETSDKQEIINIIENYDQFDNVMEFRREEYNKIKSNLKK